MKKMLLAALCCLLSLGACAPGGSGPVPFSPEETTQALLSSGAFSEQLEELDYEMAAMLFGFDLWCGDLAMFADSKVYYSTGATAELCAVIAVGDGYGGDMAAVRDGLEAWLAAQTEAERDYRPGEAEKLSHAILEERGGTILTVVAADWEKARAAIP